MKRLHKTYMGVTNSGVEHLPNGSGFIFIKSNRPLVGYIEVEDKANGKPPSISCSNVFNRTLYEGSRGK